MILEEPMFMRAERIGHSEDGKAQVRAVGLHGEIVPVGSQSTIIQVNQAP